MASSLRAAALTGLLLAACARQVVAPALPAPPVEVKASVDRAVATTGDLITYTITVERDAAVEVEIPEAGAEIAGFRITDLGRDEPVKRKTAAGTQRISERRWYKLRADLVGSYVLPPVVVRVKPPGEAAPTTTSTSEIFVEVASVLPKEGEAAAKDIRDVKPLLPLERPWPWPLIGALAALLALGLGLWWWRRRRRRPAPSAPPLPAHEVAFAALARLRQTDWSDALALRRAYFELSEVLRTYIEARFGLNATDLTTEEILRRLGGLSELEAAAGEGLRRFLFDTDRVKFAAHSPAAEEIQATYERALSFVETTRPRPALEAAA